jgi:hypothetical protein
MGVFQNNLLAGAAAAASAGGAGFYGYQIEQSCRFDSGSSSTLSKTWGSAASDGTKMSWSAWVKKASNSGNGTLLSGDDQYTQLAFTDYTIAQRIYLQVERESNTGSPQAAITTATFRDTSGWYHILWTGDASLSATSQQKLYVNGTQITDFTFNQLDRGMSGSDTYVFTRNGKQAWLGVREYNTSGYFEGYMAEVICVDGQVKNPTDFGETKNGVWIPIDYSGTYGNNGYRLKFENASDLGNDSSGNNNDFTANNMGADHQVSDSPTFGS